MTPARRAGTLLLVASMLLAGCQKQPPAPTTGAAPVTGPWNLPESRHT